MSSVHGERLTLTIFGQSHGNAIGMTLTGVPAGLPIDLKALQLFLNRRAPGQHNYDTPRKESDIPEFLSGIVDGYTCGAPITAIIRNNNTRSQDYEDLRIHPRPGHADYTASIKYNGHHDVAGGGHFSGRLTAPLCIAGGLCQQWLSIAGVKIGAYIESIGTITTNPYALNWCSPDLSQISADFAVIDSDIAQNMKDAILQAKKDGNSLGGTIRCFITGYPAGIGDALFGGMEGKLSHILFGIPAVKGVEFGAGFEASKMFGSQNNDPFLVSDGIIQTATNNSGGILGGITNGMPLVFRVAIKPTPSISIPQQTVNLDTLQQETLSIKGRHDPCIVPRAVPVVEAAAAFALYDAYLSQS